MADLRGARGTRAPPLAQNFFIFMQFSGKIGQIIGWRPPFGVSAPSSGKSWIRHCQRLTRRKSKINSEITICSVGDRTWNFLWSTPMLVQSLFQQWDQQQNYSVRKSPKWEHIIIIWLSNISCNIFHILVNSFELKKSCKNWVTHNVREYSWKIDISL